MKLLRRLWQGGSTAVFALAGWLAVRGVALAQAQQDKPKQEDSGSGEYVLAYFLVILGIALGMLLLCRSSNRRDRARPEQFGEGKIVKKEE